MPLDFVPSPCAQYSKGQNSNVRDWGKERFIDQESVKQQDGSSSGSSNPSYQSAEFRLLLCQRKGKWEKMCRLRRRLMLRR